MRRWLKEARIQRGLTMKVLSEKLGISESYYCSIEGGTRQVRMDMALASRLSKELEVPLSVMMAYEEDLQNQKEEA